LVAITSSWPVGCLPCRRLLAGGQGHDLGVEEAGGLGGGGALLALQRVGVLGFAADAVAAGDDLGGLEHRDVGARHHLLHGQGLGAVGVLVLGLGERQGLDAAGHGDLHLAGQDVLGGDADGHQAGGAHAVEGHAGHAVGQAAGVGAQAADVVGLGALLHGGAHDDVFHGAGLDAGPLDDGTHHVAAQHGGLGVVEGAAEGFGERGARGGNDDGFGHGVLSGNRRGGGWKV
jgi:hypothetical protein